jgi:hypothetical protein
MMNSALLRETTGHRSSGSGRRTSQWPYNFRMADRIACSCVTCPKCGIWVVVRPQDQLTFGKENCAAICPAPECGREFEFEAGEALVFEVPLPLFERRQFYRSELREGS